MLVSSQGSNLSSFDIKSYRCVDSNLLMCPPDLSTEEQEERRTPPANPDENPRLIMPGPSSNIRFKILKRIFCVQYKLSLINSICGVMLITTKLFPLILSLKKESLISYNEELTMKVNGANFNSSSFSIKYKTIRILA